MAASRAWGACGHGDLPQGRGTLACARRPPSAAAGEKRPADPSISPSTAVGSQSIWTPATSDRLSLPPTCAGLCSQWIYRHHKPFPPSLTSASNGRLSPRTATSLALSLVLPPREPLAFALARPLLETRTQVTRSSRTHRNQSESE